MAERDLIDDYRAALLVRLPGRSNVADIADEVEDHLRSAMEKLVRLGSDPDTAQRLTLERFGDPRIVAQAFLTNATGGVCMPTRFTRTAGYIAIAAAIAWVAAGAFTVFGPSGLLTEFSEPMYAVWAVLLLVATVTTLVAMIGLLRRAGTGSSGSGRLAAVLLVACVFMLTVFAWAWPAGGALLTIGALLVVLRARSAGLPLDASSWLLVVAFPVGTALFFVLRYLEVGPVDGYGDYPVAFVSGIGLAALLFAAALARVGRWLSREEPVDESDRMVGA